MSVHNHNLWSHATNGDWLQQTVTNTCGKKLQ